MPTQAASFMLRPEGIGTQASVPLAMTKLARQPPAGMGVWPKTLVPGAREAMVEATTVPAKSKPGVTGLERM